jgi:protein-S-isoprenylcysteine O-methyltransferase Ste14
LFPTVAYHRIKAHTNEKLDRRQEGPFILATMRPMALVFFVGAATYLVSPARMAWSSVPMPMWVRWSGTGVLALSWGLLFWTLHGLGTNLTDTVVTRREHTLVTSGPYRWVRHPFYDSLALLLLAIVLAASNWFLLLTGALFFVLIAIRSRTEEAKLLARFGESYRVYRSRTGRFLPKIR